MKFTNNAALVIQKDKKGLGRIRRICHVSLCYTLGGLIDLACRWKLCKSYVVVFMDGGICSQIHQYLIGAIYSEQGHRVLYDTSWFDSKENHLFRKFELIQMYPGLPFNSNSFIIRVVRYLLPYSSTSKELPVLDARESIYLKGRYIIPPESAIRRRLYRIFFDSSKLVKMPYILSFPDKKKCAVHVRRGDLSNGDDPLYGGVKDEYFVKAVKTVLTFENKSDVIFCFFSDGMDYVRDTLLPFLKANVDVEYICVEGHKAYEDLILMSQCEYIIASQGSAGKFAALISNHSQLFIPDTNVLNRRWKECVPSAILISE